ncbi:unnamed protein product [Pleuronectes platessa]|uniref:Uncharacterized protein n=1 Tax=Pleuronectes platessa TaxID=8262 RepID=A0A9N7YB18_PLEPL|nr:unnamed protein product [Pleuronectes platessa]
MILPLKTRILQSMAPSVEDSTITQDVKTAIREDLKPRYTSPPTLQDYLHRSTALDPRFKSLSHIDPDLRQRTYSDLTTELVSSLATEDCDEGQAAEPTGANLDTSPPQKKSAMAELFGETFASKDMDSKTPADIIKEEVAFYLAASGIAVDVVMSSVQEESDVSISPTVFFRVRTSDWMFVMLLDNSDFTACSSVLMLDKVSVKAA